jgi:TonB-dependent starch-binding outer membrane protein SusC
VKLIIAPQTLYLLSAQHGIKTFHSLHTERGNGVISGALVAPPTIGVRNANGRYSNIRAYAFSPDIAENAVMTALERVNITTKRSLLSNAMLTGPITKDLVLNTSVGVEYQNSRFDYYSPTMFQVSAIGGASLTYGQVTNIINENTLTYTKRVGSHEFKALGGLTNQKTATQGLTAGATGFALDLLENNALESGSTPKIADSYKTEYSILSYLGRTIILSRINTFLQPESDRPQRTAKKEKAANCAF